MCVVLALTAIACAPSKPKVTRPTGGAAIGMDYGALPSLPQYPCPPPPDAGVHGDPGDAGLGGRLDPVVIQRIVRAHYLFFRGCYESGLADNHDLGGRVQVRFIIGRDGSISHVHAECTSMPDPEVVECIVAEYKKLQFPRPEMGIVTVVYPIMFSPAD